MASPPSRPTDQADGPGGTVTARAAARVEDLAIETLADAERLAVGVLAEAERQATALLARARQSGSIGAILQTHHDEMMAILAECRNQLHAVLDRPAHPCCHEVAPAGTQSRPAGTAPAGATSPRLKPADEEYLDALYRAIAGSQIARQPQQQRNDVVVALTGRRGQTAHPAVGAGGLPDAG